MYTIRYKRCIRHMQQQKKMLGIILFFHSSMIDCFGIQPNICLVYVCILCACFRHCHLSQQQRHTCRIKLFWQPYQTSTLTEAYAKGSNPAIINRVDKNCQSQVLSKLLTSWSNVRGNLKVAQYHPSLRLVIITKGHSNSS